RRERNGRRRGHSAQIRATAWTAKRSRSPLLIGQRAAARRLIGEWNPRENALPRVCPFHIFQDTVVVRRGARRSFWRWRRTDGADARLGFAPMRPGLERSKILLINSTAEIALQAHRANVPFCGLRTAEHLPP